MERDQIRSRPATVTGPDTHSVGTTFCECCGNKLSSQAMFCARCGTQLQQQPQQPQSQQPRGTPSRGSPLSLAEKQMVDQYNMNINRIKDMLRYRTDIERAYGPDGRNTVEMAFNVLRSHMDRMTRDISVTPSSEEERTVNRVINLLLQKVMHGPITNMVRDLSIEMGVLVFNWNKQTMQNGEIELKTQVIDRIIRGEKTMDDTIMILRALIDRAGDTLRYTPASFDLSRHYLRSLEEEE